MFYSLADEGIQGRTGRPDALLCISDMLVTGTIAAAKEMGFRVPEDVPVIGLGDAEQTAMFRPHVTTLVQPCRQIILDFAARNSGR